MNCIQWDNGRGMQITELVTSTPRRLALEAKARNDAAAGVFAPPCADDQMQSSLQYPYLFDVVANQFVPDPRGVSEFTAVSREAECIVYNAAHAKRLARITRMKDRSQRENRS